MKHIALTALLFCFANSAWGAGYQLRYQGAEAMGTAFSSAGSYGQSLSSIYYNPGLFLTQEKDQAVALELMVLHPTKAEFTDSSGSTHDDFTDATLSGALYFGYKVDDDTAFTLAITTPWGTKSDYDSTWEGRYHALETDLGAVNIQPMISKRMSEKFMFSVGPQIQYMKGALSKASFFGPLLGDVVPTFTGDSTSVGGVLALTYIPSEKTTFAFNYTSRVKHTLRGDVKFSANAALIPGPSGPFVDSDDAETEITTPDVFTLSASHSMSEKLMGHFSVSYTNWSVFKDLRLNANNVVAGGLAPLPESVTAQNWEDTYMLAVGSTYNMSDKTILRGGVSYETGAVDNAFRTPRSFDADRVGLGFGASFALGAVNLDLALNHIIYTSDIDLNIASLGPVDVPPAGRPGVNGTYDTAATLLRLGLEYKF